MPRASFLAPLRLCTLPRDGEFSCANCCQCSLVQLVARVLVQFAASFLSCFLLFTHCHAACPARAFVTRSKVLSCAAYSSRAACSVCPLRLLLCVRPRATCSACRMLRLAILTEPFAMLSQCCRRKNTHISINSSRQQGHHKSS